MQPKVASDRSFGEFSPSFSYQRSTINYQSIASGDARTTTINYP
ncbi:MAG: hypothetical protein ACRC62_35860 [Microcoleus sp.]